jgi:hypothetical protein
MICAGVHDYGADFIPILYRLF